MSLYVRGSKQKIASERGKGRLPRVKSRNDPITEYWGFFLTITVESCILGRECLEVGYFD